MNRAPENRAGIMAANLLILAVVGIADSATGPEVSLAAFYLLPSTLAAWLLGRREGFLLALFASSTWMFLELGFGRSYRHAWTPYVNALLQLAIAWFAAWLIAALRDREQALRAETIGRKKAEADLQLERALTEAIEAEQQRLGQDLHDGLGQYLVSTGFVASMLKTKLAEKEIPEAKDAEELSLLISDAIGQSRRLARGLFPVKLEAEGLFSALQELAAGVTAHSGVECRFEATRADFAHDANTGLQLYRIAQEAANNALKHGSPAKILIRLRQESGKLELSVLNDGKEFAPSAENTGMGLRIMQRRATLIGGKCSVSSAPAGGTCVRCIVPARL